MTVTFTNLRSQPSSTPAKETDRPSRTTSPGSLLSSTGLHQFSPERLVFAQCEADISDAIKQAAEQRQPVRAIGSMHSYAPIFATEGTCIVLEQYNQLLKVEDDQVTVQSGMTLSELNKHLADNGLALPVCSAIALQTISGAISTATHGSSYYHPSLSGYVRQMRLVRADGSLVELSAGDPAFDAAVVSMGLLGIISTVTIACIPAFWLNAKKQSLSATEFINQFDSLHHNNQYLDVKYVPITDRVQILTMNQVEEKPQRHSKLSLLSSPSKLSLSKPSLSKPSLSASFYLMPFHLATQLLRNQHTQTQQSIRSIKTTILKRMLALFQQPSFGWLQRVMYKRHENNIYPAYRCDRSDTLFTNLEHPYYDPIPLHNMEIAVRYDQGPAVLQALRSHFRSTRCYPNIFIRIRVSAADSGWLSPAYGQATCWFDFCEYPYSGDFFKEIVELLAPFNFRSHWGKEIQAPPDYQKAQYERWSEFVALRDRYDPEHRFTNSSLEPFFESSSGCDDSNSRKSRSKSCSKSHSKNQDTEVACSHL